MKMKVFKGFTKDLEAVYGKGIFRYEVGKTYKEERSKTRTTGFHTAEYVIDCLDWYSLNEENRFFICEAGGSIDEEESCSMVTSTELTLVKELTPAAIAYYAMEYMIKHPQREWVHNGGGVHIAKNEATATRYNKIAIARGTHPVVWGDIGTTVGLILEDENGEIVSVGLKTPGISVNPCTKYTIAPDRKFVEVGA